MCKLCYSATIKNLISTRKYNSAAGLDGIDYSVFKQAIDESTKLIQNIMRIIIKFKCVPKAWKESNMTLIHKKEDFYTPANWRPISVINAI